MAQDSTPAASGGIGLGTLLLVLFIGLKLTGYISWSWWWVLAPIWAPLAVLLLVVVPLIILIGIVRRVK